MKKVFIGIILIGTLALAGCIMPGTTVLTPQQLVVAGNAFDAMEASATNYLRLPLCTVPTTTVVCRTTDVSVKLTTAVRAARHARSKLEAFVNANPGSPLPVNLYQSISTAISTLQDVMNQANIN